MRPRSHSNAGGSVVFWCVILVLVGAAQRWVHQTLSEATAAAVVLEKPLSSLPLRINSWEGVDVPLDERVVQAAGNDDYVNRRYVDRGSNQFVDFFLAYTATPATMLGHRPDVCYPSNGWRLVATNKAQVARPGGRSLDCLVHHFTRGPDENEGLVVLNYYVLQGRHTTDWTDFWGPRWRRANLGGDPNFYVAQAHVVATVMLAPLAERAEALVKRFAGDMADEVDALLPQTEMWLESRGRKAATAQPKVPPTGAGP